MLNLNFKVALNSKTRPSRVIVIECDLHFWTADRCAPNWSLGKTQISQKLKLFIFTFADLRFWTNKIFEWKRIMRNLDSNPRKHFHIFTFCIFECFFFSKVLISGLFLQLPDVNFSHSLENRRKSYFYQNQTSESRV